jgi:hypothetical protein
MRLDAGSNGPVLESTAVEWGAFLGGEFDRVASPRSDGGNADSYPTPALPGPAPPLPSVQHAVPGGAGRERPIPCHFTAD